MRYVIREKIFSLGDNFNIEDEFGNPRFQVIGKVFSLGDKLSVYNMNGDELFYIEQKLLRFLPEYSIYKGQELVAKIKKKLTFFRSEFMIESIYGNFEIHGDIIAYNFYITKNGETIATVNKKLLSLSDSYALDVKDGENDDFIVTLVIVIDQILHDNDGKK
ncbi:protein of unknown function DUF567 [Gottschalkia purinilytica]|uniref:Tubby C 2 n=1 Tax=Gottschalkia purinilytica TaxID=1503 RepID=A0A0L0W8I3_GOTPU|nr:LURP-one-related family protein [Gottschalkia purinilytica]KNF07757.1 protein of unknown function DUF567 [Gottschalkia purinilytica]